MRVMEGDGRMSDIPGHTDHESALNIIRKVINDYIPLLLVS